MVLTVLYINRNFTMIDQANSVIDGLIVLENIPEWVLTYYNVLVQGLTDNIEKAYGAIGLFTTTFIGLHKVNHAAYNLRQGQEDESSEGK